MKVRKQLKKTKEKTITIPQSPYSGARCVKDAYAQNHRTMHTPPRTHKRALDQAHTRFTTDTVAAAAVRTRFNIREVTLKRCGRFASFTDCFYYFLNLHNSLSNFKIKAHNRLNFE